MSVMREISRLQYVKSGRNIPAKHKVACPSLGLFGYISGRSPAKSGDLAPLSALAAGLQGIIRTRVSYIT